ncbi:Fic family protein [archaeon]|nr:Fic family protein [archaeon]
MHYSEKTKQNFLGHTLSLKDFQKLDEVGRESFFQHFIYHSNEIEGISDIWWQTINDGEEPSPLPPTLTLHKKALDQTLLHALSNVELDGGEIKNLHGILMDGLLPETEAGNYRKVPLVIVGMTRESIGDKIFESRKIIRRCPKPESLPYLMNAYEKSIQALSEKKKVTKKDLLKSHAYFEWIHPFVDGNGRVGRLMLNWLSLQHLGEFYIIDSGKRQEYYNYLQSLETKFDSKHPRIARETKS